LQLHQVRKEGGVGPGKLFGDTENQADLFVGTKTDTGERFGIGAHQGRYYAPLNGSATSVESFNKLEAALAFNHVEVGALVTVLDIRSLAVLVNRHALTKEQEDVLESLDLSEMSRAGVALSELVDSVCTVLNGLPTVDCAPEPEPESAACNTRVSRRSAGLDVQAVRTERDWLTPASQRKVMCKLSLQLLGVEAKSTQEQALAAAELVVDHQFEEAFMSFSTTLAGSDVTPLRRSYRTGETVLQSLNKLHGYDETKVYTGIHTRKVSPLPPPTLYLLCCIVSAAP
jgi:hypothetical protein